MTSVSLRHRAEYLALRAVACELLKLPPAAALRVSAAAGALAYRLLKKRTGIGRDNIAAAFPSMSPPEVEALLKSVYANLFRLAGEIFYLRRLVRPSNWSRLIQIENGSRALDVFLEGRGAILVSGHLGNWELLGHVLPYIGLPAHTLARPLDNPLVDRYILGVRESGLSRLILKRGAGAKIERILSGAGFISLLVDQDAGHRGAFVPFFGRHASTWRTPAILSQKTGAPILPGCCVRVPETGTFKVIVGEPVYPSSGDVTSETLRITRAFTSQIESWVRSYPEQYLWLHRRWKSVPGPRSLVADSK